MIHLLILGFIIKIFPHLLDLLSRWVLNKSCSYCPSLSFSILISHHKRNLKKCHANFIPSFDWPKQKLFWIFSYIWIFVFVAHQKFPIYFHHTNPPIYRGWTPKFFAHITQISSSSTHIFQTKYFLIFGSNLGIPSTPLSNCLTIFFFWKIF